MDYFLLPLGLALIIKSADVLIDATSKIARKYGVSTFIVGITVIAFGTSMPEFVVGLMSSISKANQLSLGDVIGSSTVNMALIGGLSAVLFPLAVKDTVVRREIPMMLLIQCLLSFMILTDGRLSRVEGILLLLGFALFMLYIIRSSKQSPHTELDSGGGTHKDDKPEEPIVPGASMKRLVVLSLLSLIGLFGGGKLAVDSSTKIAAALGLSETIIGLTVVAVATSLPELITSLVAVRKKEADIVLGNCVGSNIFNVLWILGLSSLIHPITVHGSLVFDVVVMILVTVFVLAVSFFKKQLPRWSGVVLMTTYVCYISFQIIAVLALP